jgi:hypothetical protein
VGTREGEPELGVGGTGRADDQRLGLAEDKGFGDAVGPYVPDAGRSRRRVRGQAPRLFFPVLCRKVQ